MTTEHLDIAFLPFSAPLEDAVCGFAGLDLVLGASLQAMNQKSGNALSKAAEAGDFQGKAKTSIELLAPAKLDLQRLILVGAGKAAEHNETDWAMLGGLALGLVTQRKTTSASLVADCPATGEGKPEQVAAMLAFGALLRSYTFTKYRSKKTADKSGNGEGPARDGLKKLSIHCADPEKARAAFQRYRAIASGIFMARDLMNEPANALGPVEFAERVRELDATGLEIEILDVDQLSALKMDLLLSVGQGSTRPSRVAVMQWNGAKSKRTRPIAFIGKGVVFDTGGISIKPAAGMEDMKGDMGGAAAVVGVMRALAERKANVNAVGVIGLVENMPSGNATRPGDIVTSMSGQTVEILNTDAEGRLVLGDIMWYAQERFKPKLMIDLATLTGAIMVALGKDIAGLYASDDRLADDLKDAAKATGEKIWRMPLDKSYDKLIDSKTADMKNIGGRWGGSCTAAAFLHRFVKDTPWAHLDIAGVAMDSGKNEINTSWGSGWGVRLLERFVLDHHEKA